MVYGYHMWDGSPLAAIPGLPMVALSILSILSMSLDRAPENTIPARDPKQGFWYIYIYIIGLFCIRYMCWLHARHYRPTQAAVILTWQGGSAQTGGLRDTKNQDFNIFWKSHFGALGTVFSKTTLKTPPQAPSISGNRSHNARGTFSVSMASGRESNPDPPGSESMDQPTELFSKIRRF